MRYKKSMIFIFLAVFLIAMATASASDANDTVMASEDAGQMELSIDNDVAEDSLQTSAENNVLETGNDETLSAGTDDEILSAGEGNYSDLRDEIGDGGNKQLTKSLYKYNAGDGDTIKITIGNTVIDGNGAIIDMSGSDIQAFYVSASGVTIKNLTIKNAKYNDGGGAVYFEDSGSVIDCTFSANSAKYGGAIYFGESGSVINCTFSANSAGDGGVIYSFRGSVINCTFVDNSAGDGGAIFFQKEVSVINCTFSANSAEYEGGAVMSYKGSVINCTFSANSAANNGGAVSLYKGSVINCTFSANSAGDSGAVLIWDDGNVINCTFSANSARYGGAVYFDWNGSVINCDFTDNPLTEGAIYSIGHIIFSNNIGDVPEKNFVAIQKLIDDADSGDTIVIDGYYEGFGIPIYIDKQDLTLIGENNATLDAKGLSSILNVDEHNITFKNINFKNGNQYYDGGAIIFQYEGSVINCTFVNNSAYTGGAVFFDGDGSVINCTFTGNDASKGSAIYFKGDVLTISNSTFLNNRANATNLKVSIQENKVAIAFIGGNNLLNAIYSEGEFDFNNVTFWGANGILNTDSFYLDMFDREAGQNITVSIVVNDELVLNDVFVTDEIGIIVLEDLNLDGSYYILARHNEDSYYTEAEGILSNMKLSANVISQTVAGKTVNLTAKFNFTSEIMGGSLTFILPNGKEIKAAYSSNGIWWAEYTFDDYGVYPVGARYSGLDDVTINNGTITLNKMQTVLTGNAITSTYNVNKNLVITLKDANGKPLVGASVIVDLNGAKTYVTDKNGQIKIPTKALNAKVYTAKITFNGDTDHLKSSANVKITVNKAANPLKVKAKTVKVKFSKLKKKTQKLKVTKAVKFTKKGQGTLTYKKVKGNKKITINKKTGKITIKKGLKKGTYKVKVKIKAKGNANYKASSFKTVTLKIKIK